MRLSTIRYVICIAETGSFTQAASQLFVSQQALSQAVQRFEQEIGQPLFIREKNRLRLTEAGQIVVDAGRKMLSIERQAYARLSDLKDSKPRIVHIGSASTYQRFFLAETLTRLQIQYPDIHIHIRDGFSHSLNGMVESGEIEYALAFEPFGAQVKACPIVREEVFLAVPPASGLLSRLSSLPDGDSEYPVADLSLCRDEPFILYPDTRRMQSVLMAETGRAGFTPGGAITGYSTEVANAMAFQGLGLAFVPAVTALMCPREIRPRYFRLRPGGFFRMLALISHSQDTPDDISATLVRLLREQVMKMLTRRAFADDPMRTGIQKP